MTIESFIEDVRSEVAGLLPDGIRIEVQNVLKNNGLRLNGIVISDGVSEVMPTIYLDPYYEDYKNGMTLSEIALAIRNQYMERGTLSDFDVSSFSDYESIADKITYRLVSADRNAELLSDVPHFLYLDLAIIFRVVLDFSDGKCASVLIHNAHLETWGIDAKELKERAFANTPLREPYELSSLYDIIKEYIGDDGDEGIDGIVSPIYAISNKERAFGAGCILYPGVMDEIAECLGGDYHVLPSSIHEVLVVPAEYVKEPDGLSAMVREVNSTQLCREDILSDHAYYYSASEHLLKAG